MYKKALLHFKTTDPTLYKVAILHKPFELEVHPYPFLRLIRAIVGQQLSVKAARTIFSRLESLFEDKTVTPEGIVDLSVEKMREAGLSYQKIAYIKDLAAKVASKEVLLDKFSELPEETVIEELIKIKGIGKWTAEMHLMFTLGRPDVFSFGDLGLQNGIMRVYNLKKKPTLKQMERLSKKWSPYRTYAALILWKSLDNNPDS